MGLLLSVGKHHGEAGDPVLLEWVKLRMDQLITLDPIAFIGILAMVIVAIPVSIMLFYLYQRRKLV